MTVIVAAPSEAVARRDAIRGGLEDMAPIVLAAIEARDWEAFGYATWEAYCEGEFGGPLRLGRSDRTALVRDLRAGGMSTRAIGSAIGASEGTVRNDIAGAQDYAPVTGLDGKTYPATRPLAAPPQPSPAAAEAIAAIRAVAAIDVDAVIQTMTAAQSKSIRTAARKAQRVIGF